MFESTPEKAQGGRFGNERGSVGVNLGTLGLYKLATDDVISALTALWSKLWRELHMQTIQVVLDAKLLKAADLAAQRHKVNRSVLIRQALQEHLVRLHTQDLEERDRRGYQARPQEAGEFRVWEEAAAWPDD